MAPKALAPGPLKVKPTARLNFSSWLGLAVSEMSPPTLRLSYGETRVRMKYSNRFGP